MSASASFEEAVAALKAGHPVIFPTDTVYGLGVAVDYASGVQGICSLKGRSADKPIAWLVAGLAALDRYGIRVSSEARRLAEERWPGPTTLVVKASEAVPQGFRNPQGTVGLRMPRSSVVMDLIGAVGCPLATTSANLSGQPATASAACLDEHLLANVTALFQDGPLCDGCPSEVIDCTGVEPRMLRAR